MVMCLSMSESGYRRKCPNARICDRCWPLALWTRRTSTQHFRIPKFRKRAISRFPQAPPAPRVGVGSGSSEAGRGRSAGLGAAPRTAQDTTAPEGSPGPAPVACPVPCRERGSGQPGASRGRTVPPRLQGPSARPVPDLRATVPVRDVRGLVCGLICGYGCHSAV